MPNQVIRGQFLSSISSHSLRVPEMDSRCHQLNFKWFAGQLIILQDDNEKPNKSPRRRVLSVRFSCMTGEKTTGFYCNPMNAISMLVQLEGTFILLLILAAPVDRSGMSTTYILSYRSWSFDLARWCIHFESKVKERLNIYLIAIIMYGQEVLNIFVGK